MEAEATPSTGGTAVPVASAASEARKLASAAGSTDDSWVANICGERRASTHPFDPGTVFPLEIRYSSDEHGSSSNSSSGGSSSSSNDDTSDHDSWWDATRVGSLLRPFHPGKQCRRSTRREKAVLGVDLPFDRGKEIGANAAWRVTGFVLRVSSWFYLTCVESDWRITCLKLRWFPAVVLTKIMRGENMIP